MPHEKPSDEIVSNAAIQKIHNTITRSGTNPLLNDLLDRETALGAYVIFAGYQMAETVKISGAPPSLVAWVNKAAMSYVLVAIEAQRQANYDLWRDFVDPAPDAPAPQPKPRRESKGDDHERSE